MISLVAVFMAVFGSVTYWLKLTAPDLSDGPRKWEMPCKPYFRVYWYLFINAVHHFSLLTYHQSVPSRRDELLGQKDRGSAAGS